MYPYGLIGNCQSAALIGETGSIDWLCMPRPDSPPVFGKILDPNGGFFSIDGHGRCTEVQTYISNTPVLVTIVTSENGSVFKITDFCPRFYQHGRMYRPISLFRIVEPISGTPSITVKCRPVNGWEKQAVKAIRGNSHLRFEMRDEDLRLVTNMPLTHLCEESEYLLKEPIYFGLTWSFGIEENLIELSQRFLTRTIS